MKKALLIGCAVAAVAAWNVGPRLLAEEDQDLDWGLSVQRELNNRSESLLGVKSLRKSALGPFTGADSTQAIQVADGLRVSLVSSGVVPVTAV